MRKNINIAKTIARHYWGELNSMKTILPGAWDFCCSSHGGIIVDIQQHPQFSDFAVFVPKRANADVGFLQEQHFAMFEEDCDASIFLYSYAHNPKVTKYLASGNQNYLSILEKSLNDWNENWFKYYLEIVSHSEWKEDMQKAALNFGLKDFRDVIPFMVSYCMKEGIVDFNALKNVKECSNSFQERQIKEINIYG